MEDRDSAEISSSKPSVAYPRTPEGEDWATMARQMTPVRGVCFDFRYKQWCYKWKHNNKQCKRSFAALKYGFLHARQLALQCKRDTEGEASVEVYLQNEGNNINGQLSHHDVISRINGNYGYNHDLLNVPTTEGNEGHSSILDATRGLNMVLNRNQKPSEKIDFLDQKMLLTSSCNSNINKSILDLPNKSLSLNSSQSLLDSLNSVSTSKSCDYQTSNNITQLNNLSSIGSVDNITKDCMNRVKVPLLAHRSASRPAKHAKSSKHGKGKITCTMQQPAFNQISNNNGGNINYSNGSTQFNGMSSLLDGPFGSFTFPVNSNSNNRDNSNNDNNNSVLNTNMLSRLSSLDITNGNNNYRLVTNNSSTPFNDMRTNRIFLDNNTSINDYNTLLQNNKSANNASNRDDMLSTSSIAVQNPCPRDTVGKPTVNDLFSPYLTSLNNESLSVSQRGTNSNNGNNNALYQNFIQAQSKPLEVDFNPVFSNQLHDTSIHTPAVPKEETNNMQSYNETFKYILNALPNKNSNDTRRNNDSNDNINNNRKKSNSANYVGTQATTVDASYSPFSTIATNSPASGLVSPTTDEGSSTHQVSGSPAQSSLDIYDNSNYFSGTSSVSRTNSRGLTSPGTISPDTLADIDNVLQLSGKLNIVPNDTSSLMNLSQIDWNVPLKDQNSAYNVNRSVGNQLSLGAQTNNIGGSGQNGKHAGANNLQLLSKFIENSDMLDKLIDLDCSTILSTVQLLANLDSKPRIEMGTCTQTSATVRPSDANMINNDGDTNNLTTSVSEATNIITNITNKLLDTAARSNSNRDKIVCAPTEKDVFIEDCNNKDSILSKSSHSCSKTQVDTNCNKTALETTGTIDSTLNCTQVSNDISQVASKTCETPVFSCKVSSDNSNSCTDKSEISRSNFVSPSSTEYNYNHNEQLPLSMERVVQALNLLQFAFASKNFPNNNNCIASSNSINKQCTEDAYAVPRSFASVDISRTANGCCNGKKLSNIQNITKSGDEHSIESQARISNCNNLFELTTASSINSYLNASDSIEICTNDRNVGSNTEQVATHTSEYAISSPENVSAPNKFSSNASESTTCQSGEVSASIKNYGSINVDDSQTVSERILRWNLENVRELIIWHVENVKKITSTKQLLPYTILLSQIVNDSQIISKYSSTCLEVYIDALFALKGVFANIET